MIASSVFKEMRREEKRFWNSGYSADRCGADSPYSFLIGFREPGVRMLNKETASVDLAVFR